MLLPVVMLGAEISSFNVALSGTPGVATPKLPFQDLNMPLTSPAEEATKNSILLLRISMVYSFVGFAGPFADVRRPEEIRSRPIVTICFIGRL